MGSVEPVAQIGDCFGGGVQVRFGQTRQRQFQIPNINAVNSKICQFFGKVWVVWYELIVAGQRAAIGRQWRLTHCPRDWSELRESARAAERETL